MQDYVKALAASLSLPVIVAPMTGVPAPDLFGSLGYAR
jgi:hypothetical protein